MIDFKDYIDELIRTSAAPENFDRNRIIGFLESNNWFDYKPDFSNGKVELVDEQVEEFTEPLMRFLNATERSSSVLLNELKEKFPITTERLLLYFKEQRSRVTEDLKFYISDFLLYRLTKELHLYNNSQLTTLGSHACTDLIKMHGDFLTDFISWLKFKYKVSYNVELIMEKRYTMDVQNEAYDITTYLRLLYYLYNEEYIEANDVYKNIAKSKNYADAWLYLSLHFICSLRQTDLERFYHPTLPYEPERVLNDISNDAFSDADALGVISSLINYFKFLPLQPNKTKKNKDVPQIKIEIPVSCEVHLGKLFAASEAHWQLAGKKVPLIRKISSYDEIKRYLGEDIGELFLERDFGSRSANKSFLQSIFTLSESFLDEDDTDNIVAKSYILASYARSHKGSYGEFAESTMIYLRDSKMFGITPEIAAFELLNRGVLSRVLSMVLEMIVGKDKFQNLSLHRQTELIQELHLTTFETESIVTAITDSRERSAQIAQELIGNFSNEALLDAMHRIGNGMAGAISPTDDCLMHALNKGCIYDDGRKTCAGCSFDLKNRSTFLYYIDEYNRMLRLYKSAESETEKLKYRTVLEKEIQPAIIEMLNILKGDYGQDVYERYKEILKEKLDV